MDFQFLLIPVVIFIIYSWSQTMPNRVVPEPAHNQTKSKKRRKNLRNRKQQYIIEDNSFDAAFAGAGACSIGIDYIGIDSDDSFTSNEDLFSSDDFSCSSTDSDFMSDSDSFDWSDNGIGANEWFNEPAYSDMEGNLYHHSDDSF